MDEKVFNRQEKLRLREEAIRNKGFYNKNGTWNAIITFPGDPKLYRERVETLIVKDGKEVFVKKKPDGEYFLPGGSTEKDLPHMDQAVNECREEAHINVRNIESTGITYKEKHDVPSYVKNSIEVEWEGSVTEVYVAEYDSMFHGSIDKEDQDPFICSGKFYPVKDCFKFFRKEHREALLWFIKTRNESQEEEEVQESYIGNYFGNRKMLKKINSNPELEKAAVEQIITKLKTEYSRLSAMSKIQRERTTPKKDDELIMHPTNSLEFSDGTYISISIVFDDSSETPGSAINLDDNTYMILIYPCFFKLSKETQIFTFLHEVGHIRLHHLEAKNMTFSMKHFKNGIDDYRANKITHNKVMYPEVNADTYAILNGAKLYGLLSLASNKDVSKGLDYRFSNSEITNRYSQVYHKYSKLNNLFEREENPMPELSYYDIACLAIYEMVYENPETENLDESAKDTLYSALYHKEIHDKVKNDPNVKKEDEALKVAKNNHRVAKKELKKYFHLKHGNPAFYSDEERKFVQDQDRISMNGMFDQDHYNEEDDVFFKGKIMKARRDAQQEKTNKAHAEAYNKYRAEVLAAKEKEREAKNKNRVRPSLNLSNSTLRVANEKAEIKSETYAIVESTLASLKSCKMVTESENEAVQLLIPLFESLSSAERKEIPEDKFGIPETHSFPLNSKKHVISAIKLFYKAPDSKKQKLADRIREAMEEFDMDTDIIGPKNELRKYL